MRFLLLGSPAVLIDGYERSLAGPVRRAVFALLVLHHNRMVPIGRVIDAVWGDKPPATARTQVQSQISMLRRMLRPLDDEVAIRTVSGGYRLETDPSEIDTAVFESTIAEGFALLGRGHIPDAETALDNALSLWRGDPLTGVEAHFARTEATRLQELRLHALDRRLALDLSAGRHAEVISELSALVAAYPLNESLLRHLVAALYGAGRRADALATYRRMAQQMRDELGLDPSPETSELFASILRADPLHHPPRANRHRAHNLHGPKRFEAA